MVSLETLGRRISSGPELPRSKVLLWLLSNLWNSKYHMEQTVQNLKAGISCVHLLYLFIETRSQSKRFRKCGLKCYA